MKTKGTGLGVKFICTYFYTSIYKYLFKNPFKPNIPRDCFSENQFKIFCASMNTEHHTYIAQSTLF